jgi:hypothetical protein
VRYAKGDGVPNSPVEAYKWLNLAAAKGNAQAVKYRDVLRGMMTPAEVAEAEKRAAAFQPRKSGKDTEAVASQQVGRRGEPNDQGLGNAEGKPRVEAQATAERGEASAQLPVGASKQGPVVQHTNDALGFSLEVPASWRTSTIALAQAFAPSDVTIEKVGEGVFEGFAPRHEGTFQWLVVMAAGRQKWPIMETSQKCIHGAQLWDKSYKASVPREVTLPNVDGKCVSFTDEVSVNGSTEKGISIMVPHEQGYIIRMQFRADPQTFDASLNGWWGIANTLRLSSTHPPLTSEQQQFLKQADDLKQCLGNLTMIDACKEQLQRDHGLRKGTAIPSQLWKRFEGKVSFECPSGGTYSIGNVGEPSSCSIAEHQQWHLAAWRMGNER